MYKSKSAFKQPNYIFSYFNMFRLLIFNAMIHCTLVSLLEGQSI